MNDNSNHTVSARKLGAEQVNIILAIAISFVCSLAIPFFSNTVIGIITVVATSAFTIRIAERKIPAVIILLVLFATFGLSNGLPIITLVLAATVGCGSFAWLISKTESPFLALIPALAYAIATVISKDWFASLVTLFFIIPAILLAQTYEKMMTRVSSLLRVSMGFLAFIVMAVIFSILYFTGELRIEIIGEFLDSLRDSLVKVLVATEITLVNGTTVALFTETEAYNVISVFISVLPALTVTLCFLLAYFAQNIQFSTFIYTEGENEFNDLRRIFIMSPVSAAMFIISFLIYTVSSTSSSGAVLSTVCANLYMIFIPGLAFMGVTTFIARQSARTPGMGCSPTLIAPLFIFLLLFNTQVAILMATCFGAYSAIAGPIRKHLSKKDQ